MDDKENLTIPGAKDVETVLASDPLAQLLGSRLLSPLVLGTVIALLIVAMIILGPSSDSRFIYTDF